MILTAGDSVVISPAAETTGSRAGRFADVSPGSDPAVVPPAGDPLSIPIAGDPVKVSPAGDPP